MYHLPVDYLIQAFLEAAAFLVIAGVGAACRGDGRWAVLATAGGLLASVVALVQLALYVETNYLETSRVQDFILLHEHVGTVLGWTQAAGFVLVAASLVVRTRGSRPGVRHGGLRAQPGYSGRRPLAVRGARPAQWEQTLRGGAMPSSLLAVVVDCRDPRAQAHFWATALSRRMSERNTDEFLVDDPTRSGSPLYFMKVPEGKEVKNRLHLDLVTPDSMDDEVGRLVDAGATVLDVRQDPPTLDNPDMWTVMLDPEGNEFCVFCTDTVTGMP